jgi:hypothetical protein
MKVVELLRRAWRLISKASGRGEKGSRMDLDMDFS